MRSDTDLTTCSPDIQLVQEGGSIANTTHKEKSHSNSDVIPTFLLHQVQALGIAGRTGAVSVSGASPLSFARHSRDFYRTFHGILLASV